MRKVGVLLIPVFFCFLCATVAPVAAYAIEVKVKGILSTDYPTGPPLEPEEIRFPLVYYVVKPSSADYTDREKLNDKPLFLYYSALIRVDKDYTLSVQAKHPEDPWTIQLLEGAAGYNELPEATLDQPGDLWRHSSEKGWITLGYFLRGYVFSDMGTFVHRTMGQEPSLDYVPIHSQLFIPSKEGELCMGCSTPRYKQDPVNPLPGMDTLSPEDFMRKVPIGTSTP